MNGSLGCPRPQLRRRQWSCLNGTREFALDPEAQWSGQSDVQSNGSIPVPFADAALGIGKCEP